MGPHNTEAARRKAYTALSTKPATLLLGRSARANPDT
ncbi:heme-binding protein [Hymenobacter nivis]|nr:heme-binding protein [Hymenobacter nivis]